MSVFAAGGGEGTTIRELFSHRLVERVVMVNIDEGGVELRRRHLNKLHQDSFDDATLELVHDDALLPTPIAPVNSSTALSSTFRTLWKPGLHGSLWTREFNELVRERLNPGGLIVAQSGPTGPTIYEQYFSAVANTIKGMFPTVAACAAFVPPFSSTWGFVTQWLRGSTADLTREETDQRITERITTELRHQDEITHRGCYRCRSTCGLPWRRRAGSSQKVTHFS